MFPICKHCSWCQLAWSRHFCARTSMSWRLRFLFTRSLNPKNSPVPTCLPSIESDKQYKSSERPVWKKKKKSLSSLLEVPAPQIEHPIDYALLRWSLGKNLSMRSRCASPPSDWHQGSPVNLAEHKMTMIQNGTALHKKPTIQFICEIWVLCSIDIQHSTPTTSETPKDIYGYD